MSTLYELFNVPENASKEEIDISYKKILEKANSMPQNDKLIEKVRRIKIAYGILSDSEKRKKYDLDLATKRADELIENVQIANKDEDEEEPKQESKIENKEISKETEERIRKRIDDELDNIQKSVTASELKEKADQRRRIKEAGRKANQEQEIKQRKKQERIEKRKARKEQQLKQEMEMQAYGQFLQSQGYTVKYPWTWLRVKRLLISIVVVIIVFFILWHIPFVKNTITDLYNENFIIKEIVDVVVSVVKSIKSD